MQNAKNISTFHIAATYIGTVVGAGFATGQEILQFFGFYGRVGVWGLLLAGILLAFYGAVILKLGLKLGADSHLKVIQEAGGKWIGKIVDWVITFFLFGALVAMAAGGGAIFGEHIGWSPLLGSALIILTTMATVLLGFSGVISAISFVVPVLLAAVLGISFYSLYSVGFNLGALQWSDPARAAVPYWPLAGVVYVSYNLVLAIAILAPLGKQAKNEEMLTRGAIWGGLGLGVGAVAILLAILANAPRAIGYEIPMAFVAERISPLVSYIFLAVLLAEIYTTAVGSLYGFVVRLTNPESGRYRLYAIGASITAFIASQFGFTNLVRFLYPAVGYAGLLMLAALTWTIIRPRMGPVLIPAFKKISKEKDKN